MCTSTTAFAWRRRDTYRSSRGRNSQNAYIPEARFQADAYRHVERHLASRICERPVPTDPFEQLAAECGLRVSVERLSLAPRDLVAPPEEAERSYLVTLTGAEGGVAARLVFVSSLRETELPGLRDALWWLASDARAIERSAGDVAKWAAIHHLTSAVTIATAEFDHYKAQARMLAAALGEESYRRLLEAYDAEVMRVGSDAEPTAAPQSRQEHRPQ